MEAELVQLAREAVTALQEQAAGRTTWVEIAQLALSGGGLCAILVGLKRMGEAGTRRDREIDELGQGRRQQGQALERQGQAMTQAFTQQGQRSNARVSGLRGTVTALGVAVSHPMRE